MPTASIQKGPDAIAIPDYGLKAHYLAQMAKTGIKTPPAVAIALGEVISLQVIREALNKLQLETESLIGSPTSPLTLSIRSSPTHSLPGVIGSVLNLGMDRTAVQARIDAGESARMLFDCYALLLEDVGKVYAIEQPLREELESVLYADGVSVRRHLSATAFEALSQRYERVFHNQGVALPTATADYVATVASDVARSFNSETCRGFREDRGIAEAGMGIVLQEMAYGNADPRSSTIACFSRNPISGEKHLYGECLHQAQGDHWSNQDMTVSLEDLRDSDTALYDKLSEMCSALEQVGKSMMDCEFTVESKTVFCLQARPGKCLPEANIQIACDLVREGVVEARAAAEIVSEGDIATMLRPKLNGEAVSPEDVLIEAMNASEGVGIGRLATTVTDARRLLENDEPFVLALPEVNTDEEAYLASNSTGILVTAAGMTSYGAILARQYGIPCVAGATHVDLTDSELASNYGRVAARDWVTIDGDNGLLLKNRQPLFSPEPTPEILQVQEWKQLFGPS